MAVALLSAVMVFHNDLQAQGRGGFRGGAPAAPAAGARGGGGFNGGSRGSVVAPAPARNGRSFATVRPHAPVIAPRTFGRRGFVAPVTPFYDPFYDPFLFSSPYYPPTYPAAPYAPVETPAVQQDNQFQDNQFNELTYEVERLSEEVRRLREEQAVRVISQPPPPAIENQRPATPTTLVFRDGRQIEAQGYAILGQTIWILTEQSSSRVSLADLDLGATQRVNAERGIRFLIPRG
jgi:hypothetical protein